MSTFITNDRYFCVSFYILLFEFSVIWCTKCVRRHHAVKQQLKELNQGKIHYANRVHGHWKWWRYQTGTLEEMTEYESCGFEMQRKWEPRQCVKGSGGVRWIYIRNTAIWEQGRSQPYWRGSAWSAMAWHDTRPDFNAVSGVLPNKCVDTLTHMLVHMGAQ